MRYKRFSSLWAVWLFVVSGVSWSIWVCLCLFVCFIGLCVYVCSLYVCCVFFFLRKFVCVIGCFFVVVCDWLFVFVFVCVRVCDWLFICVCVCLGACVYAFRCVKIDCVCVYRRAVHKPAICVYTSLIIHGFNNSLFSHAFLIFLYLLIAILYL